MKKSNKKKILQQITLRNKISKKNWLRATAQRNKMYVLLDKDGKVMELAKDALFNTLIGFVKPQTGDYFCVTIPSAIDESYEQEEKRRSNFMKMDARSAIPTMNEIASCQVCAKGSLLVSAISFKNKVTIGYLDGKANSQLTPELKKEFTQNEFDLIERVFENGEWGSDGDYCGRFNLFKNYYSSMPSYVNDSSIRMCFIMSRIIQYKGNVLQAFSREENKKPLDLSLVITRMKHGYVFDNELQKRLRKILQGHILSK